tara:strand:- start:14744 stop:15073 length:330 start_codon:yes stop_codon:yes gene_type:complete
MKQETNMYTDIITQSIPKNLQVANVIASRNFVFVAPTEKSELEGIQIFWIVSQDTILVNFASIFDDNQSRSIKNASSFSLMKLQEEIQNTIKGFNFSNHWKGYDSWRHT